MLNVRFAIAVLLLLSPLVSAEEQLDLVVKVKLNTPPEHQQNYAAALQREFGACFPRILKRTRPGETPPDGAAPYRLLVEASGTVSIGNAISSTMNRFDAGNVGGSDAFTRIFHLPARQQVTLNVKLLHWEKDKYSEWLKFTAPVPPGPEEENANGLVECARITGRISQQGDDKKPPCTLEQAQSAVLGKMMPGSLRDVCYSNLLDVKLVKAEPNKEKPGELKVEVTVQNKTPWGITQAEAALVSAGKLIAVGEPGKNNAQMLVFEEPLLFSKTPTKLTAAGREIKEKRKPGVRSIEFFLAQ
ncbi:MAG TPA: hypothetical protein VEK08_17090 [Planctomycetota bacterium]|nr:hypothetical protein [Planctomycetota bacterium]